MLVTISRLQPFPDWKSKCISAANSCILTLSCFECNRGRPISHYLDPVYVRSRVVKMAHTISVTCFAFGSTLSRLSFLAFQLFPALINLNMKRLFLFIAMPLCFAAPAFSTLADAHAHARMLADEQQAMVINQECTTRTKVVTHTSYEINVVSTVYRHRTQATTTPNARLDGTESTVVFGVEGTGCDMKACSICRMLNNCSDEENDW
jgi:hypothetical protein